MDRGDGTNSSSEYTDTCTWRPAMLVLVLAIVLTSRNWPARLDLAWATRRSIELVLVLLPFWISYIVAYRLERRWSEAKNLFKLEFGARPPIRPDVPRDHAAYDREAWRRIRVAVQTTWEYERRRYVESLKRLHSSALMFGALTSTALAICVMLHGIAPRNPWLREITDTRRILIAAASALGTAFVVAFARIVLRLSSGDVSSRMFAWATRSVALAGLAAVGLFIVLVDLMTTTQRTLLLGIFVGAAGEHAILPLLEKTGSLFKLQAVPASKDSPLLAIEGMTAEHVERLEEEDIRSVHDLAFVPTARLFFPTPYSLQQICNWQDRALLIVYVGVEGAKALERQMKLLGALDLRACCHALHHGASQDAAQKAALLKALSLDEGGLDSLIDSMAHDEVTMRVRLYWQSAVTNDEPTVTSWAEDTQDVTAPRESDGGGMTLISIEVTP
jgi:hypothetical protein